MSQQDLQNPSPFCYIVGKELWPLHSLLCCFTHTWFSKRVHSFSHMLCRWTLGCSCSWPVQHTHSNIVICRCQTHWKVKTSMQGCWVGRGLGRQGAGTCHSKDSLIQRAELTFIDMGLFNLWTQNMLKEEGNIKEKPWIIVPFRGGPSTLHQMLQWFLRPLSFLETERAFSASLRYQLDKESRKLLEDQGTHLRRRRVKRGMVGSWHQPESFHPGLISSLERDAGPQAGNWGPSELGFCGRLAHPTLQNKAFVWAQASFSSALSWTAVSQEYSFKSFIQSGVSFLRQIWLPVHKFDSNL